MRSLEIRPLRSDNDGGGPINMKMKQAYALAVNIVYSHPVINPIQTPANENHCF